MQQHKKNLIVCFSSIRPENFGFNNLNLGQTFDLSDREKDYELALTWLLKVIPENWDIVYNDNTLNSLDEIQNKELKRLLKTGSLKVLLHNDNNASRFTPNKKPFDIGIGYLTTCVNSFDCLNYEKYNWITSFTARHIITTPYYFDLVENKLQEYEIILSNPVHYYFDKKFPNKQPIGNWYNDMLFSMKADVYKKYIQSIDIEKLRIPYTHSEKHLYNFVNAADYKVKKLEYLGILRNNYSDFGWHLV